MRSYISLIEEHRAELNMLCEQYRVQRLDLFGSAAKGTFKPESSDLDFVVSFDDPGERGYARRYYYFAESLEHLFQRPVDLLTQDSIQNSTLEESVNAARLNVYEQRSAQTTA